MDPTPYFIMGSLSGVAATLLIQAYGRRRVKKALVAVSFEKGEARVRSETAEMARRLAVLEQIVTDRPVKLATEIEGLR